MYVMLRRRPDDGQSLAELGLILGFIALVGIVALLLIGGQVSGVLDTVSGPV
jgi:Flp pilus assembly pilin Flp